MFVPTVILSALLALVFLGAGVAKLRGAEPVTSSLDQLQVSAGLRQVIGALEVAGAVGVVAGLWLQPLGILAAIGLVLVMVGAVFYHARAQQPIKEYAPAVVILGFAIVVAVLHIATA